MKTSLLILIMLAMVSLANAQLSLLPGDASVTPAVNYQTAPSIATGDGIALGLWVDTRANPFSYMYSWGEYETSHDIYGVRLDAAGNVLDPVPIPIVSNCSIQNYPKAAWNGSNWLVVYQSVDVSGTGYYYQASMEAVRVSPTGQVLDTDPIKLYGLTPSGGSYWAVASDGNNWVVVNQSTSASSDIVAVRVSPAGVLLDPPTRSLVPSTYYSRSNLQLAYAGGVFLLTFNDAYNNGVYDTKALRFDSNLNKLDAGLISLLTMPLSGLAGNGANFYAVWGRQETDFSVHVVGSRVSPAGVKLDGNGVNISGTRQPGAYAVTAVVWDGVNWGVTWGELNTAYVARVNSAGVLLNPGSVALSGPQTGVTAGLGNGALQIIWSVFTNNYYQVFSANVSPANVAGPNRQLPVGASQQLRPDAATSGDGYMIVYRSNTAAATRILAQPLDVTGNPLTAEPVQLETGPSYNGPGHATVAWNGSTFLAAWGSTNGIVAQRLLPDGTKVDAAPFMVMTGCFGPVDVAALGGDFLVSGRKIGINAQYIFPVAARVSGAGVVLDASPLVLGNSFVATAPAVVALGSRWLMAWHRNATHDNSYATSQGAFIPPAGAPTAEFQIHGPFSTAGGNGIFEVGLASSGSQALFVQSQELTSGVETDLLCRVIDASGTVGPQLNLTPWSGNQYRPRVGWDGVNFIVAYQDEKNRLATQALDQLDARSDLYAMRVSPTGTIVDPQGFVFSASSFAETDPNVVASDGVSLLTGSVMVQQTFANYRIAYQRRGTGGNQWPVAVINASVPGGDVPLTVNFTSIGSVDPDGNIVAYHWDFDDGTSSEVANPSVTFTVPGARLVTLVVTDNQGVQTRQATRINVTAPNQLPVAVARADHYSGNPPLSVVFYADGSYDPDGFIGNIEWQFSDGGSYWGSPAYYTFDTNGTYGVTLRCYDGRGGIGTTSLTIYVGVPTPTPTATPTATPPGLSISGTVSYCSNPVPGPVSNATLTLTGNASGSQVTGASGSYLFSGLPTGGSYVVTPSKAARTPGSAAIDTLDVIAVQRHFLAVGVLSGCRLTAADVNGDANVNTTDIIAIQRFFLGLSTGLANTGKYRCNPVNRTFSGLVTNQNNQNFDILALGDVAPPFVE